MQARAEDLLAPAMREMGGERCARVRPRGAAAPSGDRARYACGRLREKNRLLRTNRSLLCARCHKHECFACIPPLSRTAAADTRLKLFRFPCSHIFFSALSCFDAAAIPSSPARRSLSARNSLAHHPFITRVSPVRRCIKDVERHRRGGGRQHVRNLYPASPIAVRGGVRPEVSQVVHDHERPWVVHGTDGYAAVWAGAMAVEVNGGGR